MAHRKHVPDPNQLDLLKDRARQIRILRDFSQLKTTSQKAMLMLLELHIGRYNGIEVSIKEIARQLIMSVKSAYRVAAELQELDLIGYVPSRKEKVRFWIGWGRLQALYYSDDQTEKESAEVVAEAPESESLVLMGETSSLTHENSILMGKTPILMGKTSFLTHENCTSSISATNTSTSTATDRDAAMRLVKQAGVDQFGTTVETALAQGMTTEQIAAVVAHFQAFPGRWSAGILRERLIRVGAHLLAADEGWYGDEAWHTAQQQAAVASQSATQAAVVAQAAAQQQADQRERETLQQAHGDTLGKMTREQLLQLAATHPDPTTADRVRRAVLHGFAAAVQLDLLRLLDSQKGQA